MKQQAIDPRQLRPAGDDQQHPTDGGLSDPSVLPVARLSTVSTAAFRPLPTALERAWPHLLALPLLGLIWGRDLVGGLALSDLLLTVFTVLVFWRRYVTKIPLTVPSWLAAGAVFGLWALLAGSLRLALGSPLEFSFEQFLLSAAKLGLYLVASVALCSYLEQQSGRNVRRWVGGIGMVLAVSSLGVYLAVLLGGQKWDDALWLGQGSSPSYFAELRWFGDSSPRSLVEGVYLRARGLDTEPSEAGLLMVLVLAVLTFRGRDKTRTTWCALALLAVAALATFSLTTYAMLGGLAILVLARYRSQAPALLVRKGKLVLAGAIIAGSLLVLTPAGSTMLHAVLLRTVSLAQGSLDNSAKARLIGSWEIGVTQAQHAPILGAGLGNVDVAAFALKDELEMAGQISAKTQGWNSYAYVLGATGVPGMALFLFFVALLLRQGGAAGGILLVMLYLTVEFLVAPFWILAALLLQPFANERLRQEETAGLASEGLGKRHLLDAVSWAQRWGGRRVRTTLPRLVDRAARR